MYYTDCPSQTSRHFTNTASKPPKSLGVRLTRKASVRPRMRGENYLEMSSPNLHQMTIAAVLQRELPSRQLGEGALPIGEGTE